MTMTARHPASADVEVGRVCVHGFDLEVDGRSLFLSYDAFPWFRDASMAALADVERPDPETLYWPRLSVALKIEAIESPDRYPIFTKIPTI